MRRGAGQSQRIHKLSVNLAGSLERGCVRSTNRSRFGVAASLRCCCDWLSAQSRSTDNAWIHRPKPACSLGLADYKGTMLLPKLIAHGGPMVWLLFVVSAVAVVVFVERLLYYHRAQINSAEFLSGVRNVLKRDNVVEAISICDATPGPVARLVKIAILSRERGRDRMREGLEEAGLSEVPRLEEKLNLLATIAQIAPIMGLLGSVLGFVKVFEVMSREGPYIPMHLVSPGVWECLLSTAAGLAVAIPAYAGYNFLVSRVNAIVLDMEKASTEMLNYFGDTTSGSKSP